MNMASTNKDFEGQNILSQLVACLVSMGYQVNQYIMDSWTYGSCQQRSRIILTIAAPGLEPIVQQPHTHSRPSHETAARSLGRLPNGERFGDREHYATPFPYMSAQEATADLPNIGNGNVQSCVAFPDHRLSRPTSSKIRALLECIPRYPAGHGYAEAVQLDLVPPLLKMTKKSIGKAYRRIQADGLIPTITTFVNMQDAYNGASVHWAQHRPLTIQEAKRTQGYSDPEPVIGSLNEQWKTLGNGVDRKVSLSLGLALRDALARSKRVIRSSESVQDEIEMLVDVEDETNEWLSEAEKPVLPSRPSPSPSSSTGSFSPMRGSRQDLDFSPLPDGVREVTPQAVSPNIAPLQKQSDVGNCPTPDKGLLSRLSQKVTENARSFSLPVLPSFLHSTQLSAQLKRQRDEDDREPCAAFQAAIVTVKRAKIEDTRSMVSPTTDTQESDVKLVNRQASLPLPERTTHTRSSGPAQYAPRAWNKEIGSVDNVVDLT